MNIHIRFKSLLIAILFVITLGLIITLPAHSLNITDQQTVVGVTYYGGHYDEQMGSWIIDNVNQCSRIAAGEFTAESLSAVVSPNCDDDNGLGYIGSIPLHNTVSFAELSNDPANPDYAALGKLPSGTKLQIQYGSSCVVAEKRDVGQGGPAVNGHLRALDLWWQTARSLGFANGFDNMSVRVVDASIPLSPIGSTSSCMGYASAPAVKVPTPKPVKKVATPPPPSAAVVEPVVEAVSDDATATLNTSEEFLLSPTIVVDTKSKSGVYAVLATLLVILSFSSLLLFNRNKRSKSWLHHSRQSRSIKKKGRWKSKR